MSSDEVYYELYGEYISLRELAISTAISTFLALLLFSIAPRIAGFLNIPAAGISITLGAVGASLGFAVSVFVARVKRFISEV